ncbi:MAG: OadG family protein, partial [Clostridia bacterium]|nr:OadG family protein [Clostridia bacterium]
MNGQSGRRDRTPPQSSRRGRRLKYVRRRGEGVNPGYIVFAAVIILIVGVSLFFIFRSRNGTPPVPADTSSAPAETDAPE